jgi:hypothetical protein
MNSIYYCTMRAANSGGEMVNEEHVLALREKGLRAYLFYIERSEQGHFASRAPVLLAGQSMAFAPGDVVVIPEPWREHIDSMAPIAVRKVMHCQNPYYLFNGVDSISHIAAKGITAVMTCSDYTTQMLQRMGYQGPAHTVQPFINPVFGGADMQGKRLQIAYMPRKREIETRFVKGLFQSLYPEFSDIPWVPIHGVGFEECARILRESAVFAAFSHIEGLGLPPLEAMASDCVVAGFHGLGGQDYATPQNGLWVVEGDHFAYAHALAEALRAWQTPHWLAQFHSHGRATVARYHRARFLQDLCQFWDGYLGEQIHEYLLGAG